MAAENAIGFLRGLAQGRAPAPVVLIAGAQAFLREYVIESLRRRLALDGFSYRSFQVGAGAGFGAVMSELEGADLFAPKRMIACRVLRSYRTRGGAGSDDDGASVETGESGGGGEGELVSALERIAPSIRLALIYERDNAPVRVRRVVEKSGMVVTCGRPFDNQLGQYAELFARNLGLKLSSPAVDLIVGRHGGDLGAMANAIAKAAISCGEKARVEPSDLREGGAARIPELFELAESIARGQAAETIALFDRALAVGRDPIEILAVELIPLIRRMLVAASISARHKGTGEVASAMGLPPSSNLLTRAVEGARRFGLKRLSRAHQRAAELDARFKMGLIKEREQSVAGLILELMAG